MSGPARPARFDKLSSLHRSFLILALLVAAIVGIIVLLRSSSTVGDSIAATCVGIWVWKFVQAPSKYSWLLWYGTVVGLVIFGAGTFYVLHAGVPKNDFLPFYLAAQSRGRGLYSYVAVQGFREAAAEKQYPMPFLRIPFYSLLLRPLAWMSYRSAYLVWQVLSASAFIASAVLSMRRYRAAIAAFAWSYPVWLAWGRGQDVALLLLVLLGAVLLLEDDWPFAAGVVLALCSLKWNLFLSLPIFVLRFRSKRLLYGATLGVALITAISFTLAGPRWLLEYSELLKHPFISPHIQGMPNLAGLFFDVLPASHAIAVTIVLAVGVLVVDWMIVNSTSDLWYAMAATCLSGILITPHAYPYDCALLIPFLVAVGYSTKSLSVQYLAVLVLTPVFGLVLMSQGLHILSQLALIALMVAMLIELRGRPFRQSATVYRDHFSEPRTPNRSISPTHGGHDET